MERVDELKGTIIAAEIVNRPGQIVLFRVAEPFHVVPDELDPVTLLRDLREDKPALSSSQVRIGYETFIYGGQEGALMFEGVREELELRHSPPRRVVETSITGDDNKSYWGS